MKQRGTKNKVNPRTIKVAIIPLAKNNPEIGRLPKRLPNSPEARVRSDKIRRYSNIGVPIEEMMK